MWKFLKYLSSALLVFSVAFLGSSCTALTDPLKLVRDTHYEQYEYGVTYIVGYVKNNSYFTYSYVEISFGLHDSYNHKIWTACDNTTRLEPGETLKF